MTLNPTQTRDLDHKFQRIVIESKGRFANTSEFATFLHDNKFSEFSYKHDGMMVMAKPNTIEKYIAYARAISLIDNYLKPTNSHTQYSNLEKFQQWLSGCVIKYLNSNNASLTDITSIAKQFLSQSPPIMPTIRNVHNSLRSHLPFWAFDYSVKIISLLRSSKNYRLQSNPVFIINGVLVP